MLSVGNFIACMNPGTWRLGGGVNPPTVKLREKSGKIQVKILRFSGKICVKSHYFCEMITIFVKFGAPKLANKI
jgi:hypothetical protein